MSKMGYISTDKTLFWENTTCDLSLRNRIQLKTLPKAQRTRGLSSTYQSNFFRSYHKFRISTKYQLQNLNQTSAFRQNLSLKSQPRLKFTATTKHQQGNTDQASASNLAWTSTSKSWPNLETLCSKSEQKLNFMTKLHLPNLHQTVVSTFLIINMSNSNNLNKFWVVIFTRQGHINQVY